MHYETPPPNPPNNPRPFFFWFMYSYISIYSHTAFLDDGCALFIQVSLDNHRPAHRSVEAGVLDVCACCKPYLQCGSLAPCDSRTSIPVRGRIRISSTYICMQWPNSLRPPLAVVGWRLLSRGGRRFSWPGWSPRRLQCSGCTHRGMLLLLLVVDRSQHLTLDIYSLLAGCRIARRSDASPKILPASPDGLCADTYVCECAALTAQLCRQHGIPRLTIREAGPRRDDVECCCRVE